MKPGGAQTHRTRWMFTGAVLAFAAVLGACASPVQPIRSSDPPSAIAHSDSLNLANIKRMRTALPAGYEVADLKGLTSPARWWGFGAGWTAEPPRCGVLADPAGGDGLGAGVLGLSASGPGGIVYVAVAVVRGAGVPDPGLLEACREWTLRFAHTIGTVSLVDPPAVDGATTVAMRATTRTIVESGSETDTEISSATAYVRDHVVFITLITNPGSRQPALPPQFAAELLIEAVKELRG